MQKAPKGLILDGSRLEQKKHPLQAFLMAEAMKYKTFTSMTQPMSIQVFLEILVKLFYAIWALAEQIPM